MTDNSSEVIDKYKDTVFRIAYTYSKSRYDSDDIFQEVFLRYYKKKPTFNDETHEKAWFIRVTINCSKKLLGSAWWKKTITLDETISFKDKEKSDLFYAVMELPKKYRIVVHLYYFEDYSVREISEITSQKEPTIQSQLLRARAMLKDKLERTMSNG